MTIPLSQFMVKQWKAFVEDMKGIRQAKKSASSQKTGEKKKRSRIQEEDEDDLILIEEETPSSDNSQPIISSFADRDDILTPTVQKSRRQKRQRLFRTLCKVHQFNQIQPMNQKRHRR